jgi:hypothetical protein
VTVPFWKFAKLLVVLGFNNVNVQEDIFALEMLLAPSWLLVFALMKESILYADVIVPRARFVVVSEIGGILISTEPVCIERSYCRLLASLLQDCMVMQAIVKSPAIDNVNDFFIKKYVFGLENTFDDVKFHPISKTIPAE